ncbi:MAG: hypothetical protein JW931_00980 [Methanomicrobiaceae archaeon]|nr:hypothetical protein [Methanomicrobiaceae archaeon]
MESNDLIILGLLVLNVLFLVVIVLMKVRINMLSREMKELKGRMEFSNSDIDLLADAIRDLGSTRF